ncbi:MAG: type II toxin-antitoxin system VapC family toxin [Acidimicrobiales bacterium]
MASLTHLDTHVAAWLYVDRRDLLSATARDHIERDELAISPMAILELTYLHEVGRRRTDGPTVLSSLRDDLGVDLDPTPFGDVVRRAHSCSWTRDPFDRLIGAQALTAGAQLLTRDAVLLEHVKSAVW